MKKRIIAIISMAIMLISMFGCIISNDVLAEDETQEYSDEYKKYLELSDEEKSRYEVIPRMYDVPLDSIYEDTTAIKDKPTLFNLFGLFARTQVVSSNEEEIPEQFDLREEIDIKVENQNPYGLCWTFPSLNALETYLQLNDNDEYDFSEMHLAYIETEDLYGSRVNFASEGNFATFENYIENEHGPVWEEEVPYNRQYTTEDYDYLTSLEPRAYVEGTVNFPTLNKSKYKYTDQQLKLFRNKVKKHIMENGSVYAYVTVWWVDSEGYISRAQQEVNGYYTMYTKDRSIASGAHAVSIIGWDDNFPKENFINETGEMPEKDGAYLVLDSQGTNYCDNGTYWISYEDWGIEMDINGVTEASIPYIEIVQNPIRTEYVENEEFDITGMIVKMHRENNEEIISDYTILDGKKLKKGQENITIQYGDYKQTIDITVYSKDDVETLKFNDEVLYYSVKGSENYTGTFAKIINSDDEQKKIIVLKEEVKKATSLSINDVFGQISDLTGLSKLYNLNTLELSCQQNITDISEIGKLANLQILKMTDNDKIQSIEPLNKLTQLEELYIEGSMVKKDSVLEEIEKLIEKNNITKICIINEFTEEDFEVENDNIILPQYFSKINQKEKPTITAEIEYYKQETNEIYKIEEIPIEYDENNNLKIKLDKKVLEQDVKEVRSVKIYIEDGMMAGTSSSIMYQASDELEVNINYIEINGKKIILNTNIENNKVEDIANYTNFPNTNFSFCGYNKKGDKLTAKSNIGTGDYICIIGGNNMIYDTYYIAQKGDIDSNGQIDLYDILQLTELVFDTDSTYIWDDCVKLAGKCAENSKTENPDLYDIQRLIEYYFDNKKW